MFVKKILKVFVEAHLHPASGIPAAADERVGLIKLQLQPSLLVKHGSGTLDETLVEFSDNVLVFVVGHLRKMLS